MATITSLGFSIFSTYSGRGVTAARRDLNDLSNDLDKNKAKLASSAQAFFSLSTAAAALAPALQPIGVAAVGVTGAIATLGVTTATALGIYGIAMKSAITQTLKLAAAHKALSPVQKAFVTSVNQMKTAWQGFINGTQNLTLTAATVVVQGLTAAIGRLAPVVRAVHPIIMGIANDFKNWAAGDGFKRFIDSVITVGVPALRTLVEAGKAVITTLGIGFRAFLPLVQPVADALLRGANAMKGWAQGGGFDVFVQHVQAVSPQVIQFFKALFDALKNINVAMAGLGPVSLSLATILLKLIAALPPSVLQAIIVAIVAIRAAMLAWAIASTVATVATIALEVAASPFFILMAGAALTILAVVAAIAALGVAIFFLVTHWKDVSAGLVVAWNAVWNGMKVAAIAVWNALKVAWTATVQGLIVAWTAVSQALVVAWNAVWNGMKIAAQAIWLAMQVAWSAFINAMALVWRTVSAALVIAWNAVWNAMKVSAQAIWLAMQVAWTAFINVLAAVWRTVSAALSAAWSATWNAMKAVAQAIWSAMQAAWNAWINAMKAVTNAFLSVMKTIWSAAWNAMKTAAEAIWNAMKAAWNAWITAMKAVTTAFLNVMKTIWSAAWNAMKTAAAAIWNAMKAAWTAFTSAMKSLMSAFMTALKAVWSAGWNAIKTVFTTIINAIKTAWDAFSSAFRAAVSSTVNFVKTAWAAIKEAFQAPIHFVIDTVINKGILGAINWVLDKLGAPKVPLVPVPFKDGGYVSGPGSGTSDSIPARLSNGEFVMKASAVKSIGVDKLNAMNGGGMTPDQAISLGVSPQVIAMADAAGMSLPPMGAVTGNFADGGGGIDFGSIFGGFEAVAKGILGIISGVAGSVVEKGGDAVGGIVGAIGGLFGHPHAGDSIKNGADAAGDALKGWGRDQFAGSIDKLIGILTGNMGGLIKGGIVPGIGSGGAVTMGKGVLQFIKNKVVDFLFKEQQKKIDEAKAAQAAGSPTGATTKSVQAWASLAAKALAMAGLNANQLGAFLALMQAESGGNPNAINRTDINAKNGTPSIGLMQVIGPTFSAYHVAGTSGNIYDPLANMAASANYIKHRYGGNVPGSPYYSGTDSAKPGWHMFGEHGPEMAFANGGEKVFSAGQTRGRLRRAGGGGDTISFSDGAFTFNFNGGVTKEALQHVESDLVPKLRMAVQAGVGKRN